MTETGASKFVLVAGTKVCDFVMSDARGRRHPGADRLGQDAGAVRADHAARAAAAGVEDHGPADVALGDRAQHLSGPENDDDPDVARDVPRARLWPVQLGPAAVAQDQVRRCLARGRLLALDKPEDVRKLRSTEYTGIAFNELAVHRQGAFRRGRDRGCGFPGKEHGGSEWHGVIGDSNAPDEDHWLAWMTGQIDLPPGMTDEESAQYRWPDHWRFHFQPGR
jgi:hypothetical protein